MAVFAITANDHFFGEYIAESAEQALDMYAQDAGYDDFADLQYQFPAHVSVIEKDIDALTSAVTTAAKSGV